MAYSNSVIFVAPRVAPRNRRVNVDRTTDRSTQNAQQTWRLIYVYPYQSGNPNPEATLVAEQRAKYCKGRLPVGRQTLDIVPDNYCHSIINGTVKSLPRLELRSAGSDFTVRYTVTLFSIAKASPTRSHSGLAPATYKHQSILPTLTANLAIADQGSESFGLTFPRTHMATISSRLMISTAADVTVGHQPNKLIGVDLVQAIRA